MDDRSTVSSWDKRLQCKTRHCPSELHPYFIIKNCFAAACRTACHGVYTPVTSNVIHCTENFSPPLTPSPGWYMQEPVQNVAWHSAQWEGDLIYLFCSWYLQERALSSPFVFVSACVLIHSFPSVISQFCLNKHNLSYRPDVNPVTEP